MSESSTKPYAGIICSVHGKVDIDVKEYDMQLRKSNNRWTCPKCRRLVKFDNDRFEAIHIATGFN